MKPLDSIACLPLPARLSMLMCVAFVPLLAYAGPYDVALITGWNSAGRNVIRSDWIAAASPMLMPPLPADGDLVAENPPVVAWPIVWGGIDYQLEIKAPNGSVASYTLNDNFFAPPGALSSGKYSWRVKPRPRSGASAWSDWRSFTVSSASRSFVLPQMNLLVSQVTATAHPRGFPRGAEKSLLRSNLNTNLINGWKELRARVNRYYSKPALSEPRAIAASPVMSERMVAQQSLALPQAVNREAQQIVEACWLWQLDGDVNARTDAKRRVLSLAQWDVNGPTSYHANARAARSMVWSLAVGFDALYSELSSTERSVLLAAIEARIGQIISVVDNSSTRLGASPYDTTMWVTVQAATAAAALITGDSSNGGKWLTRLMPWAVHSISPWGGDDGGYGNGTAYAGWTADSLFYSWDVLRWATGVDVYQKRWLRAFGNYFAYFLPPGSPAGAFGEAAENLPETKYGKALAYRLPLAVNQWYGRQLSGDDMSDLLLLSAGAGSNLAAGNSPVLPNSAVFPSIGWAAIHSNLADINRTSIYFKSSPYGSYNHSHADQNSFVVNAKGKRLAIDSGYYDWYGSPHWTNWYKKTVAHNAITFDGGQGQLINRKDANGEITDFRATGTYDSVTGNAVKAYGGALTRAQRSLVHLRPDFVLVYDALESALPRTWEWNIHALNRITPLSGNAIEIVNGDARLCIELLDGPAMAFSQTDQFAADPDKPAGSWSKQWHGRFSSRSASAKTEIVTLLRLGCANANGVAVVRNASDLRVSLNGRTVTFSPGKAPLVQ